MYPRTFVHLRGTRVRVMTQQQEASLGPGWFAEDQMHIAPEVVADAGGPAIAEAQPIQQRKRGRPRKH